MKQNKTSKKRNYIISCISSEFSFLWIIYIVAALFFFGFFIFLSVSSNGAVFGFSDIKNGSQLEKFLTKAEHSGILYADSILNTNLQVTLTESTEKGFNVQMNGAYWESPSFTVSTYDRVYDIYLASLEDSLLIVLYGDIFTKEGPGLDTCESISIDNTHIEGTRLLVDGLKERNPEFFSRYEHIYVVKGDYPMSLAKPFCIALSVFLMLAVVLFFLPRLTPLQRLSHFGRQVSATAKAERRTFREMCILLNEYAEASRYRNGNQILTERYMILRSMAPMFMDVGERMDLYAASESYGKPFIRSITIEKGGYPEEMNDILIAASNGKYHRLTIHQPREAVAALIRQLGF